MCVCVYARVHVSVSSSVLVGTEWGLSLIEAGHSLAIGCGGRGHHCLATHLLLGVVVLGVDVGTTACFVGVGAGVHMRTRGAPNA